MFYKVATTEVNCYRVTFFYKESQYVSNFPTETQDVFAFTAEDAILQVKILQQHRLNLKITKIEPLVNADVT